MKVLHLTAGHLFGGIETYLLTLARQRSVCPAMEPHFGVCFAGRLREELAACGVGVHELGPVRLSRPWTVWRARRRLLQLFDQQEFTVVVCHVAARRFRPGGAAGRSPPGLRPARRLRAAGLAQPLGRAYAAGWGHRQ